MHLPISASLNGALSLSLSLSLSALRTVRCTKPLLDDVAHLHVSYPTTLCTLTFHSCVIIIIPEQHYQNVFSKQRVRTSHQLSVVSIKVLQVYMCFGEAELPIV